MPSLPNIALKANRQTSLDMIAIAAQANVPAILWGTPGEGKSSTVTAIGEALGAKVYTFVGSIHDPTDLGFPYIKDGVTYRAKTDWVKEILDHCLDKENKLIPSQRAILFLDELTTCPPAMQQAMLRVVLDRVVGSTELPENVMILSAANDPKHVAGGQTLTRALANRLLHINDFELKSDDFVEGIMNQWPAVHVPRLPDNWLKENYAKAATLIAGYIHSNPGHLRHMPDDDEAAGKAWASPRTWHKYALRVLAASMSLGRNLDDMATFLLVSGSVSFEIATAFQNFVRTLDLPDPEEWLANPSKAKPLQRSDQTFTAALTIVNAVENKSTKDRWTAACQIMCNIAAKADKDVAAVAVNKLMRQRPQGALVPPDLMKTFSDLFLVAGMS